MDWLLQFCPGNRYDNQPAFGNLVTLHFQAAAPSSSIDFILDAQDLFGPIVGTTEGPITATVTGLSGLSIVPEPATFSLVMAGLAVLGMRAGRRR